MIDEAHEIKNDMIKSLAILLIEYDPNYSFEEALSIVFNSDTYQKVMNDVAGLYSQSPKYVFSFLKSELETGKME